MYDKSYCRTSLHVLKRYVKLGVLADEFGLPRTTLSMFMKDDRYDYQISQERINEFIQFIYTKLAVI